MTSGLTVGVVVSLLVLGAGSAEAEPPFGGAIHDISTDILTADSPSSYQGRTYVGLGERRFWDAFEWVEAEVYVFNVHFARAQVEFQVDLGFESVDVAAEWVEFFATEIGRLPSFLLRRVREVEVAACYALFTANQEDKILHVNPRFVDHLAFWNSLGEYLLHEAGHMLDTEVQEDPEWIAAQQADGEYISEYARDYAWREDVAETAVAWYALRKRPRLEEAVPPPVRRIIRAAIPNRLAYFDRMCEREACW